MTGEDKYVQQDLLGRVASGDQAAFTFLFHQWYPRLLAYIIKITRSQEVSEEIVQDVFTRVWINRADLERINNFQGYLFVAARNHALNELQKIATYWKHYNQMINLQDNEHPPYDPYWQSTPEIIEKALDTLSPRQKEIWLLNRRHQYTYDEIAARLGISRETVKTHLQSATKTITEFLRDKKMLFLLIVSKLL